MQPLWPILVSAALLAPTAADATEAPAGLDDAVERIDRLDPAAQRDAVRELSKRLDRADIAVLEQSKGLNQANVAVTEPEEAARLRAKYVALLQAMDDGRRISVAELRELVQQTDRREKEAIELLARQFRVEVYQTFRQQRGVFTRRRAAWNRVLASWATAGNRFQQQDRLLDWLESAIRSSLPGGVGPLPADPQFEMRAGVSTAIALDEPAAAPAPTPLDLPSMPAATRDAPEPNANRPVAAAVLEEGIPDDRTLPAAVPPSDVAAESVAALGARLPLPPAASEWPTPAQQPSGLALPSDRVVSATSPAADLPGGLAMSRLASRRAAQRPPAVGVGQPVTQWPHAEHLLTEMDDPFRESSPAPASVQVNLNELAARIAGNNLAIRALEADIDRPGGMEGRGLAALVDRLRGVLVQRRDLTLVRQVVSPSDQTLVGRLESPETVLSRLEARISEARRRALSPGYPGTETERQAELAHLDTLSRQLAQIASRFAVGRAGEDLP